MCTANARAGGNDDKASLDQHTGPVANRLDHLSMYPRIPSYDHALSCHGPDGEDRVARKSCSYRCVKLGEITGTGSRRRRSGVVFEEDEKQVSDLTTEVA